MSIISSESKNGKMRCGGCGHDEYRLYSTADSLDVVCSKCESRSQIKPQIPKLQIKWGEGPKDTGVPCVFARDIES